MKQHKNGIGLLELMLSLIVISGLLVGVTRYYTLTQREQHVNVAAGLIQSIRAACDRWRVGHETYEGISSLQDLVDRGYLPDVYDNNPTNPWGGSIEVSAVDSEHIKIRFTDIPVEDCNNLMDKFNVKENEQPSDECVTNVKTGLADYEGEFD